MAGIAKGTVFGGRYIVQSQVGTGGMATVYRGIDSVLDRSVAIKVMLPQYANDPAFAQRFKQEAQAAAALQNPYIVQVYDWGRDETTGTYYIVMEYLRGTDLKTGIRSHGALAPRKVAQIGAQVCSALAVAHAHDIIHRDIKPQNIMIQPNGDAKVMDFGIARAKNSHLTQTNSVLGTAHYVSPEQAQGKDLGPTSDLYSLGVVMYEAATGKLPFDGDDAVSVALKQVNEQAVPPSEVNPNVDDRLETIIMRCMAKDPRQRFQTADELRHVLNNYINGRPLGIPTYAGAAPTTRLAGNGTATQMLRPGDAGRTSTLRGGTTGTQRLVRDEGRGATQRMGQTGRMAGANGMGGVGAGGVGMNTTTDRRSRNVAQQQGGMSGGAIAGITVVVVIVIAAILFFALTSCNSCSNPAATNPGTDEQTQASEKVKVPDVENQTEQVARNRIEDEGLKVGTTSQESSSTVDKGKVIRTSPAAGTEVDEGSTVNLVVSSGPQNASLPTLNKGMAETAAVSALKAAGFNPQHDTTLDAYDAEAAEGTFLLIDPSIANKVNLEKGATVKYGLSKGVDPATLKTAVPTGLVGAYYTDAEAAVTAAELTPNTQWINDDTVGEGYVVRVDPGEGTGELDKKSTVTIYVSSGPAPITLDDYTGGTWSYSSVQTALANLGLYSSVDTSMMAPSAELAGIVYQTNPAAGATVEKGTTVAIYAYGDYVPPAPTSAVVSDYTGWSAQSAIDGLTNAGFYNVSVVDENGNTVSGNFSDYTVTGIDQAGQDTPFGSTIIVRVQSPTPVTPEEPDNPSEGGSGTGEGGSGSGEGGGTDIGNGASPASA